MRAARRRAARKRLSRTRLVRSYLLACSALLLATQPTRAQDSPIPLPRNEYGSVGLIDMPSARMMPDGSLTMGASFTRNIEHFNFGFQVTPWLETGFHYSGLEHLDTNFSVYYDRAFAAKIRLWDEDGPIPAVAVGANDLIGTGIYSGEYLVASKSFGPVDATFGLGWGRLGSTQVFTNPLSTLSNSFNTRNLSTVPGSTAFNVLFHGDVGVFGGLVWQTPIPDLSLLAEYSSDKYVLETERGTTKPQPTQFNFGAAYRWEDDVNLSLDWLYGDRVMGAITFQFDTKHDPYPEKIAPAFVPPRLRTQEEQQQAINALLQHNIGSDPAALISSSGALVDALWARDQSVDARIDGGVLFLITRTDARSLCRDAAEIAGRYVAHIATVNVSDGRQRLICPVTRTVPARPSVVAQTDAILAAAQPSVMTIDMRGSAPTDAKAVIATLKDAIKKQDITVNAIDYQDAEITLYYTNSSYLSEAEVIRRLTQLLMADAPASVEKFRLFSLVAGLPQREFDVMRAAAERDIAQSGDWDTKNAVTSAEAPMQNPILTAGEAGAFPRFSWGVFPQFRQQLFDPNNPFAVQFLGAAGVGVELRRGLTLYGEGEISIYDNFNTTRPAVSLLPHVRTDYLNFFTQGRDGFGQLGLDYRFRLAPGVFAIARAGYLESMYMGAGGEVLWRPSGERWAIGADLYDVQERGFDRLLDLQKYHVVTGHVTVYWASPWYDLNFQVRAGQYLAGDRGITFMASRRFSTGVEVGAFFTRTNVSAAQFGEGSFDKGIIVRIPLGWVAPINTKNGLYTILRPVQRDGGQTLTNDATLYEETRQTSEAEMMLQTGENF